LKVPVDRILTIEPIGYLDFVKLMVSARLVLTDSGGIQEETTALGIPCLTIRENTERPITIEVGTNRLVGNDADRILEEGKKILQGTVSPGRVPELWDGRASERIVKTIDAFCS
jgi:UDP-N-acetylglucosamine 2-epimerase (non-hydrolysing)